MSWPDICYEMRQGAPLLMEIIQGCLSLVILLSQKYQQKLFNLNERKPIDRVKNTSFLKNTLSLCYYEKIESASRCNWNCTRIRLI